MSDNENRTGLSAISASIKQYLQLLVEDTRLSVTEKLTRLLASIALASLLTILITVVLLFATISGALALSMVMSPVWAFIIVAGFFLLIMALLIIFRMQLLVNPIARYLSRLLLPAPQPAKTENNDESASVPQ